MNRPPREPDTDEDARAGRGITWPLTMFAIVLGLAGIATLLLLAGNLIGAGLGFVLLAYLNYLAWGWWLGPLIRRSVAAEEERQTADPGYESEADQAGKLMIGMVIVVAAFLALLAVWNAWPRGK